jgi:repressor LexA
MRNDRSLEILAFIERFRRDRGLPPTIREIGEAFQIASTNGVRYHLHRLEKMGKIRRREKISRGIESATQARGIPILGRVAAGQPILAEECYEGRLESDDLFGDTRELFALRVRGDSMIEAGIMENDYVVVRHQETAQPGAMIVALVEDEATVKYYRPSQDRVELVPANAKYRPIVVPAGEEFRILGIVRGVVRTLAH